jgi:adenylate cyclase
MASSVAPVRGSDRSSSPYENRVERSFAFIDLSGFTTYTDTEGDGAAVDILTDFRLRVREIAARRGVRIAKWLGDGAMLVAVDPEPLTEAIVDMEEVFEDAPLALRAGLSSGPVILFEGDDYIGAAVNLAARLCAKAQPGEVLAAASMMSNLMVNTQATDIGDHEILGFADPVALVRLDSAD